MSDLKPCPFCGGAAVIEDGENFLVRCNTCHATTCDRSSERSAIYEWNTRTPPKVKPLEWDGRDITHLGSTIRSKGWLAEYFITKEREDLFALYWGEQNGVELGDFKTEQQAVDFANADFKRHVLEALA